MRFLIDECTGPSVARWLEAQGHDAASIYDESPGLDDISVLQRSVVESRILITNDRDFTELIFRDGASHAGVIYLRLDDERPSNKIRVIELLLASHASRLAGRFTVVTETQVRFASGWSS